MKNTRIKSPLSILLLLFCSAAFGQINNYSYKRDLKGISDQWHKIILPDDIFSKIAPDFSDIRIFGITKDKDTLEAPYVLQIKAEKATADEMLFKLINQSTADKGYYFTFEVPGERNVNQLELEFKQTNFDWRVALEGSQDQHKWFSIVNDYRILAIQNEHTNFKYTKINFSDAKYNYFRLFIKSDKKPELASAKIVLKKIITGDVKQYTNSVKVQQNKKDKQTLIDVNLATAVPVAGIKIAVKETFDYYRPITIKYLSDSVKAQQGWIYNYTTLLSGTLNAMDNNEFRFSSTIAQKLKITIDNGDNEALNIDTLLTKGYSCELTTRFSTPATYYLVYGNNKAMKPNYDINHFTDKIPAALTAVQLGGEEAIEKAAIITVKPLFENKLWLWLIMAFIIVLLGGFSLMMIKKKE